MMQDLIEEQIFAKSDLDDDDQVLTTQMKEQGNTSFILNVSKQTTLTNIYHDFNYHTTYCILL
jgi:hypothetical protein